MNTTSKKAVLEALDKLAEISSPEAQLELKQVRTFIESLPKSSFSSGEFTLMMNCPSLGTVRVRSNDAYESGKPTQIEHQRNMVAKLLLEQCERIHKRTGLGVITA